MDRIPEPDVPFLYQKPKLPLFTYRFYPKLSWIDDITWWADAGYLQASVLILSVLWTIWRLLNRRYSKISHPEFKASQIKWLWEIAAQASRATTLVFLTVAVFRGQTPWLNAATVAYAFVLGLLRLVNDLEWRHIALHQLNAALATSFITLTASTVLPCIEARNRCAVAGPVSGGLISLGLSVLISLVTPREWIPPSLEFDIPKNLRDLEPAPEETCSWANYYLTYSWLTSMMWKGARGDVSIHDLPRLAWYDDPSVMLSHVKKARGQGRRTFFTLMRLLHKEIKKMAVCIGMAYAVELVGQYALYNLLAYLADPEGAVVKPWVWLLLMFCAPMARSFCFQQYVFTSTRLIVRVKSALTQELYHRALSSMELESDIFAGDASAKGKGGNPSGSSAKGGGADAKGTTTSAGRLANLMAADVDAVYNSRDVVMIAVGAPIGTAVAVFGLYQMLGWPALVGTAILISASPVSVGLAQMMAKATRKARKAQDARISLVTEYLTSIKAVKYFSWETAATTKINDARKAEQRDLWRVSMLYLILNQVVQIIPYIALIAIFSLYVGVLKQPLTAAVAFTTVTLVKTIRRNIAQASFLSRHVTGGMVALDRLDRYFDSTVPIQKYPEGPLRVQGGEFRRNALATFRLTDISINFVEGGLNVVTGQSGSGKTTLLLSILGETLRESGSVVRPKDVAFASQSPWLQNESIRDNILFNSPYEQVRYDRVVEACCLPVDLSEVEDGDGTIVGENGSSLSGGQKARVALARALYSRAPLLLLDDIFSALDAKTAASLWELCFCSDMLKGRTVVLVSQQPWVSAQADLAVTLENGTIKSIEQNIDVVRRPVVITPDLVDEDAPPEPELQASGDAISDRAEVGSGSVSSKDVVAQEMMASGKGGRFMFFNYMTYFGSPVYAVFCLLLEFVADGIALGATIWLTVWIGAYDKEAAVDIAFYLGVYAALVALESIGYAAVFITFEAGGWHAARRLHNTFIQAVMRVSLSWYKTVPVGRIVNRFSRDMYAIDTTVCQQLRGFTGGTTQLLYRLAAISSILPIFMLPATLTCAVGILLGEIYTRTAVTVKKLVASSQSPVFTQFSDTLAGLSVIRARDGMPEIFGDMLAERLRVWSRAAEANYNCNRWVAVRIDGVTALVGVCAGMIAVWNAGVISAGLVGFSLTNATGLNQTILGLVRNMNDLEVELQSFVRVKEYAALEPEEKEDKTYAAEGQYMDDESQVIPKNWPGKGEIEFRNVTIRYDKDGLNILTDINLKFRAGERVAIVGRTGSGKSTLVLSMLRFTEIMSGEILYDGMDITKIPRRRLREALTIIPQEAVLFNGTVGSNLDPTGKVPGETLQKVLDECKEIASFQHTSDDVLNGENGHGPVENGGNGTSAGGLHLSTSVNARGENFSHGQRQVLSLCRALVRKSKLMLLDEATASMDYETDRGIQEALRRELRESGSDRTLVTIAHRLRTIIDYDTVVVMGGGKVLEAGAPVDLYHSRGQFYEMVCHSGELDDLRELLEK